MARLVKGFLAVIFLMLTACATQTGLSEEFDRSVKAYNRLLRWHEIESAGATYLDPELQEDFLKQTETLKKKGLSVTDFRILSSKYIPEKKSGDVIAEFDYYILPSNRIKTISYHQDWVYQESIKSWKLKSKLPAFE
ncbi:MAG: hypothetical protein HGB32_01355 [Geobacteraceae bacterium]|nr:hypothetical protein [Geobacteraceae bacterium]NTW78779.1 hypothetical protein [Geobacteraceae bacterium]